MMLDALASACCPYPADPQGAPAGSPAQGRRGRLESDSSDGMGRVESDWDMGFKFRKKGGRFLTNGRGSGIERKMKILLRKFLQAL